jgi:hypothetical protein
VLRQLLSLAVLVALGLLGASAGDKEDDTPNAAKARKLLKKKITVDFKNTRLEEVVEEIQEDVKGLRFRLDTAGGVSRNRTLTYKGKDQTVEQVLDGLFKKAGLGYYIISKKGNAYDGTVLIIQGKARGYPPAKK